MTKSAINGTNRRARASACRSPGQVKTRATASRSGRPMTAAKLTPTVNHLRLPQLGGCSGARVDAKLLVDHLQLRPNGVG